MEKKPAELVRWGCTGAFLALAIICCSWCLLTIGFVEGAAPQDGFQRGDGEKQLPSWRPLTRDNFTSELKQHEFSLCIATLPWSGESRKLMKDILRVVKEDPRSYLGLQLFYVHTNKDRLLGKIILGASISPSFTLFKFGTPHKYHGKRSISSIMASIRHGISVLRSDSVLLNVKSALELENFTESTDKAVVLFDFCGWERELRQELQRITVTDNVESVGNSKKLDENQGPGNGQKSEKQQVLIKSESSNIYRVYISSQKLDQGSDRKQSEANQQEQERISTTDTVEIAHSENLDDSQGPGSDVEIGSESGKQHGLRMSFDTIVEGSLDATQIGEKQVKKESPIKNSGNVAMFGGSLDGNLIASAPRSDLEKTVGDAVDDMADCISQDALYCVSGNTLQNFDSGALFCKNSGSVEEPAMDPECGQETVQDQDQALCSSEEYEIFEAVYRNVSKIAEDSLLTPQRTRFAIVTDEEVTSQAGISTQGQPWLLLYLVHDFDRLPYSFDGVGEVGEFLADHSAPLVIELEGEEYSVASSSALLPNDTPSVILFIDRISDSPEVQQKSKDALDALRAFSYYYASAPQGGGEDGTHQRESKGEERLDSKLEENISPLLGKEQAMVSQNGVPNHGLGSIIQTDVFDATKDVSLENMLEKSCVIDKESVPSRTVVKLSDSVGPLTYANANVKSSQLPSGDSAVSHREKSSHNVHREANFKLKKEEDLEQFVVVDEEQELDSQWSRVLGFYFIDGEDNMKEKLTRSDATPALVLVDPQKQAHYIIPLDLVFNFSSLLSFVDSVLSGEVKRTVLSEPQPPPPRQPPRPPFVNRDFHDQRPVPRVTADSFSKMVTGAAETDEKGSQFTLHWNAQDKSEENGGNLTTKSAWEKDVLVLFTTPWCGFCKRMELVVREVYRSFQLVKGLEFRSSVGVINLDDHQQNANYPTCVGGECLGEKAAQNRRMDDPPVLLQMDCTLNDCSDHLGEVFEKVTYPAVVLFPSRNKLSPVVYKGAPTVKGIYDFLRAHGTTFSNPAQKKEDDKLNEKLINNRGIICIGSGSEDVSYDSVASSTSIKIGADPGGSLRHESATFGWELNSRHVDFSRRADVVVGSVLHASEKLLGASPPFENSLVLIVSTTTTPHDMVHGLIVNKPMDWKNVQGLDGRVKELLSTAPLGYGGPVVENHRPFLVLTRAQSLEDFTEVAPGWYYGFVESKCSLLEMIHTGRLAAKDFWFFLGYSSWTLHQLQIELAKDLWHLRAFSDDLVKLPLQLSS